MAESAEHQFLAQAFNEELLAFSQLELYSSEETARRQFDFASRITRTWSRALVGQTLWRHTEGIEKDIRTLLFEQDADIRVYVVRGDAAVEGRVASVLDEFKASGRVDDQMFRLVRFVAPVFDADDEDQRAFVARRLREQMVESLLFRVVFGRITARDVQYLLHWDTWRSSKALLAHRALPFRLLNHLGHKEFISNGEAARALDSNRTQVRTALDHLRAAEMLATQNHGYVVTEKGHFLLDLISRLAAESRGGTISAELRFLCERLGLDLERSEPSFDGDSYEERVPPAARLIYMLMLAKADIPDWDLGELSWLPLRA